jgi:hypothetical protein
VVGEMLRASGYSLQANAKRPRCLPDRRQGLRSGPRNGVPIRPHDFHGAWMVAQITVEVLDRELDYPRAVVDDLAHYSNRFGFAPGDGVALLDHLLHLAGSRDRDRFLAEAGRR